MCLTFRTRVLISSVGFGDRPFTRLVATAPALCFARRIAASVLWSISLGMRGRTQALVPCSVLLFCHSVLLGRLLINPGLRAAFH
ncbi:MAG: hypothetical protein JWP51_4959 [Bradyrhizobium sp.]|nr:hypothetical protein [Bradyrhizobium sp.]